MITSNSRYVNAPVGVVNDAVRGGVQAITYVQPLSGVYNFTFYQWEDHDTIDWIAFSTYGDGTLWWKIANANPEILLWETVRPGTIIRIPNA